MLIEEWGDLLLQIVWQEFCKIWGLVKKFEIIFWDKNDFEYGPFRVCVALVDRD